MIRMVEICSIAALWLLPSLCFAQVDTMRLVEIEVVASAMQKDMAGVDFEKFTLNAIPLKATQSLNSLLNSRTNLVLKGYGPGSSFGISIRGSSTSQTQILLNGIPFENPGLATSDVSLLANGIASTISIYRGSASGYLGNASIGGSVLIRSGKPLFNESISQTLSYGSFGSFGTLTAATYGTKQFAGTTKIYFREADNDFLRIDPYDRDQLQPQPNAAFKTKGIAQDFYLKSKGATSAHFFLWASETDRQIPPVQSKPISRASQKDQSFRAQAIVSTAIKSVDLKFNTALDHGFLNYKDPDSNLDENSEYTTVHIQTEARTNFGETHVFVFGIFRDSYVLTEQYAHTEQRMSPALVIGADRTFWKERTRLSILLRQEFLNTTRLPLLPVLSLNQHLSPHLDLNLSAGRAYRLPGLNDLYWNPGGNPNLKPESGWFQEAQVRYSNQTDRLEIKVKVAAFHRLIENWIQWMPGPKYWSASNIRKVDSRGLEGRLDLSHSLSLFSFIHSLSITYAQSTSLKPLFAGDKSVDKQLIYTPLWSLLAKEEIAFLNRKLTLTLLGKYQSLRYTTADNSRSLDPYFLVDVEVGGHFNFKTLNYSVFGALRNIFDTPYQLKAAYPMPGIFFETGIKFNLNFKPKKINSQ